MEYINFAELKRVFCLVTGETMMHENQNDYYAAINDFNTAGESAIFVTFMLKMLRGILKGIVDNQNDYNYFGTNDGINLEKMLLEELLNNLSYRFSAFAFKIGKVFLLSFFCWKMP